jgi:putative SOS response-associated peptidase YedK
MPVVLQADAEALWLDPDPDEDELLGLLLPAPDDALVARDVGDFVNDVRDDGPHLIERRAEAQPQLF